MTDHEPRSLRAVIEAARDLLDASGRTWNLSESRGRLEDALAAYEAATFSVTSEARATGPSGLDVERLAEALHWVQSRHLRRKVCSSHRAMASAVAAEYARRAADSEPVDE